MKPENKHLQIAFKVDFDKSLSPIEFEFEHTEHSYLRACQRGFTYRKIAAALQYGESIYKQGLIYFVLGENNIPDSLSKLKDKLKNTVVIVAGDSNKVITCYRTTNPFKYIRVKSERLCKKYNHAA